MVWLLFFQSHNRYCGMLSRSQALPHKAQPGFEPFWSIFLTMPTTLRQALNISLGCHIPVPARQSDTASHRTTERQQLVCCPKLKQNNFFGVFFFFFVCLGFLIYMQQGPSFEYANEICIFMKQFNIIIVIGPFCIVLFSCRTGFIFTWRLRTTATPSCCQKGNVCYFSAGKQPWASFQKHQVTSEDAPI